MRIAEDSRMADQRVREWFLFEKLRRSDAGGVPAGPARNRPLITLSREFGAGGHTVAERAAKELGSTWTLWDRELIDEIAKSAHVVSEMVSTLDEHTQSWADDIVLGIFGRAGLEIAGYRKHLSLVLLALAQQGRKIIVGRGANFLLPNALNVRLEATLGYRIEATMQREAIDHDEAARRVHAVDHDRADYTRRVFGRDVTDRRAYDMVIQVDQLGMDAAAAAICAAARAMFGADA